jgi:hypothetical protein
VRRWISFGSTALVVAVVVAFHSVLPWWAPLILVAVELVVFAALGSYWADKDAAELDRMPGMPNQKGQLP